MTTSDDRPKELISADLIQKVTDICSAVNTVTNADELLKLSLEKTMALFGAERGSIFLAEKNKKNLVLKSSRGMALDENKIMVKKMGQGIVGRVAESKRPIVVEDIASDARFGAYKPRKSYKTQSFICSPLLVKDSLVGVITMSDKTNGHRFRSDELQLLDFLSAQIALNHRRIELYEKFRGVVRKSRNLKDELGKSSQEAHDLKKQVIVQEKLASIGKLAGGIAHEFNNPLDGVMRYTNLCLEQVKEDDVIHSYLVEIRQGLNRMAGIVRNLLACSRSPMAANQTIEVNQAIEQALFSVQKGLVRNGVAVEKDLSPRPVRMKDFGMDRIFANIFQNAIDAVDEKEGRIMVSSRLREDAVEVTIKDNGCGMPEAIIAQIFEPFYTTKDIERGCGLGLTIVSEIVKSYNGQIEVKTNPGEGTTFKVILPLKES